MQDTGAYVEQIRPGAKPPAASIIAGKPVTAPLPAAGLYVQVAEVRSQAEAVRASLALSERLGPQRPRFIRGEVVQAAGETRILMYAGPFADDAAARAFCKAALPSDTACIGRKLLAGAPGARARTP